MKKCPTCKKEKKEEFFSKSTATRDGLQGQCKKCRTKHVKETGYQRTESYKKGRKKNGFTKYQYRKEALKRYEKKHPERIKARIAVKMSLKTGAIKKQPCAICGAEKAVAHHYKGYAKENWLIISWLCKEHHRLAHYE